MSCRCPTLLQDNDVIIVKRRCKMTNALASISPYYLIFFLFFPFLLPYQYEHSYITYGPTTVTQSRERRSATLPP